MHTITKLVATAALLGSVSTYAMGQPATTTPEIDAGAQSTTETDAMANDAATQTSTDAALAAGDDQNQSMSTQDAGPVTVEDIEAFDEGRTLNVVTLEDVGGDAEGTPGEGALGDMVDAQAEEFDAIVAAIEANTIIADQLEAEGHSIDNIVAIGMGADNGLMIVIEDAQ